MDLCLVRHARNLALVPATDIDRDRLARLPRAYPMEAQVRFSRTSKLNRWYRGLIGAVAEAIDVHPQALHNDLKLKAGLVEQIMLSGEVGGIVSVKLRSTAFPEMEEAEFSDYVDFVVKCLFRDYLPGIRAREQQKLIVEWAGRRPALDPPPKLLRIA